MLCVKLLLKYTSSIVAILIVVMDIVVVWAIIILMVYTCHPIDMQVREGWVAAWVEECGWCARVWVVHRSIHGLGSPRYDPHLGVNQPLCHPEPK